MDKKEKKTGVTILLLMVIAMAILAATEGWLQDSTLHEAMLHNNIAHTFIVRPGSHNHDYWRNALEYQLLFFHNYFDREAQPQ